MATIKSEVSNKTVSVLANEVWAKPNSEVDSRVRAEVRHEVAFAVQVDVGDKVSALIKGM